MTLKIAHISDVHLGAKLVYLGAKADDHRGNIKKSFQNAINAAMQNKVDVFIVAGDLFDTSYPSKSLQIFALEEIKKLINDGVYVVLISGNHDRTEKGSVYDASLITEYKNDKLIIFSKEAQQENLIEELSLRIVASGTEHQKNKRPPYTKLTRDEKFKFNIGVFHGSVDIKGQPENNPIYLADLNSSKFDYFALGDWHNLLDLTKEVSALYSGSPELVDSDQERAGNMLIVTLEDGKKAKVEQMRVGTKAVKNLRIDISQFKSMQEVLAEIKKNASKDMVLNLTLTGFKAVDFKIEEDDLLSLLSDDFYFVNILDSSKLRLSEKDLAGYPETMLIGRYIKLLLDQKKDGDDAKNALIDEAIQLGVSLLKGGRL